MTGYRKGANAERELIHMLWDLGMAVVRVAGSGATALPAPDLVALSREKKLAFECKAWDSAYLTIGIDQMAELDSWCKRAGAEFYIAWKIPRAGWLFLPKELFNHTGKNYTVSKKHAVAKALKIEVVAGRQSRLGAKPPAAKAAGADARMKAAGTKPEVGNND